ncbi:putative sporulation protein rmd8 [Neofusicoccum parvum]|uniref:Putative sporulation protein rmd8 protein n=1 Tax=Botryosphaeria parva (strain UCR-NP2) TaxID=1287680 RepID=R1G697_BOTPV|nr:putative sporulation protein rmd8 protein [Neofusicoccum parvum UCRNP2]GME36368.1 putative sporulation protein rmd8 [Neofusicoccum parvum]
MASTTAAKPKRGPTVLVTDAREVQPPRAPARPAPPQRTATTRLISVDNVLQYASEIPSGQRRGPPERPRHTRTPSGRHPLEPKLSGRLAPQYMPSRSSKVSEKLVLLPEASEAEEKDDEDQLEGFNDDEDLGPPDDNELERIRSERAGVKEKSYAERLPKARRAEKLSRVTAYCTAQSYKLRATADFVKNQHGARTKLYDDCLYTVYHLPLLGGHDGYRVRSSPVLKSPGGKSVLDEEIERNENREYHEGYFGDSERFGIRAHEDGESPSQSPRNGSVSRNPEDVAESPRSPDGHSSRRSMSPPRIAPDALGFGEMFVFSYGVVVFWNFTERQEKDILADLTFSQSNTGVSLVTRPQREEDFETEEFHFEYNPDITRPRVYNDMITLRSGDHMIKLAMSHAIAQSTKLCFFEERMAQIMLEAQYVPRRLALTGKLASNMLDIPNFFWESEPTLHPLYVAIREYLEIKPRIQVLNERCRVFLDLAEILSDSIADKKMTRITWIIIVLIILSILVTCSEVFLRFGILTSGKKKAAAGSAGFAPLPMCSPREELL